MRRKAKIRVIIVLDNFNLGGAERQALLLAKHLNDSVNYEAQIAALIPKGNLIDNAAKKPLFITRLFFKSTTNIILHIFRVLLYCFKLRKYKPDVLIPFTVRPNVIVNFAWQLSGAKCSFWNQRDEGFGFPLHKSKLFNWSFNNATGFIANSRTSYNALLNWSSQIVDRVVLIPNGSQIAASIKSADYYRNHFDLDGRLVAVMVGNLTARKDHATVVKAWNHLRNVDWVEKFPKLILVGKRDEKYEEIHALVKSFSLEADVLLIDFVEDVAGILSVSDIAIHSSQSEGMPNSILEYMQNSKPIVASRIQAHQDILGSNYDFFFEPGDYRKLAELVYILSQNPKQRNELGSQNRERFSGNYTAQAMADAYFAMLDEFFFKAHGPKLG